MYFNLTCIYDDMLISCVFLFIRLETERKLESIKKNWSDIKQQLWATSGTFHRHKCFACDQIKWTAPFLHRRKNESSKNSWHSLKHSDFWIFTLTQRHTLLFRFLFRRAGTTLRWAHPASAAATLYKTTIFLDNVSNWTTSGSLTCVGSLNDEYQQLFGRRINELVHTRYRLVH